MAKKVISYKLNTDGTVPDYVEDGGYLAKDANNTSNMIVVGISKDGADLSNIVAEFVNEAALLAYVVSKGFEFKDPITKEVIAPETVVSSIWNKLGGNQ